MSFKISLAGGNKAQLNLKARAEEGGGDREEDPPRKRGLAQFFEDEHDDEHDDDATNPGRGSSFTGPKNDAHTPFVPQGPKRHFAERPRSMVSGPGTLEQDPLGPFAGPNNPGKGVPRLARYGPGHHQAQHASVQPPDAYTTVVAKLSNLPPTMDQQSVEKIFTDYPALKIAKVEKMPPPTQKSRPAAAMKVTFVQDATARDLDVAINKLNDKLYLGRGYFLHIDRYFGTHMTNREHIKEPFGAEWKEVEAPKGVAPTEDIGGATGRTHSRVNERSRDRLVVTVRQPTDISMLRLINQTIDLVIQGGQEAEAALMNVPHVASDERYAFLYDQKHPNNIYYRWRMYCLLCPEGPREIFRDQGDWEFQGRSLVDEFATKLHHLNPDEEDIDVDGGEDMNVGLANMATGILDVKSRTNLIWLLKTIPPMQPQVHEIAGITAFVLDHANQGIDEIVQHLITNIFEPFSLSKSKENIRWDDPRRPKQMQDASLNGLRIVSDVADVTSREGGAWKYRESIGTQLSKRGVFEHLDKLPGRLEMGRASESQFRKEVNLVIKIWNENFLFSKDLLERFHDAFNWRVQEQEKEAEARKQAEKMEKAKAKARSNQTTADLDLDAGDGAGDVGPFVDTNENEQVLTTDQGQGSAPTPQSPHSHQEDHKRNIPTTQGQAQAYPSSVETSVQDSTQTSSSQPGGRQTSPTPVETAAVRARKRRPRAEDFLEDY